MTKAPCIFLPRAAQHRFCASIVIRKKICICLLLFFRFFAIIIKCQWDGALAQLVARDIRIVEVRSSNLLCSTIKGLRYWYNIWVPIFCICLIVRLQIRGIYACFSPFYCDNLQVCVRYAQAKEMRPFRQALKKGVRLLKTPFSSQICTPQAIANAVFGLSCYSASDKLQENAKGNV